MLRVSLLVLAIVLAGCQSAPAEKSPTRAAESINGLAVRGGDGSSLEKAVEIMAKTASEGVPAEYAWIRARFPGARPSGKEMTVYFDITKYMGKL